LIVGHDAIRRLHQLEELVGARHIEVRGDERHREAGDAEVLGRQILWGGATRADRLVRKPLEHGDVVVWGGPDRLRFHGVSPLAEGSHPLTGGHRINLTFRRAG
jgi:hypothetical protein